MSLIYPNKFCLSAALIVVTLFSSCGDKVDNQPMVKNITRTIIAPERVLQKTDEVYYIATTYFKDYTEKDHVKLTVDGQEGTLEKEKTEELTGTNLLFKLPASGKTGDLTIKLTIDNGQEVIETEQNIRFVPNYDIATVWGNLDNDYYEQIGGIGYRSKNSNFGLWAIVKMDPPQPDGYKDIGNYFLQDLPYYDRVHVPFVPGLSGSYRIVFDSSSLKELRVSHGGNASNQSYSPEETRLEIESIQGIEKISEQNFGSRIEYNYRIGEFTLKLIDSSLETYSVITK